MSTTPRELEIAPVTSPPQWVLAFNEAQNNPMIEEGNPSVASIHAQNTVLDILKKTLFWSSSGSVSCCLSLLIGKILLELLAYPIDADNNTLGFAAIGGSMSYFIFKLLAEVVKKAFLPCTHTNEGADAVQANAKITINQMILQSFLLNLGGIFLGVVVLLHPKAPEESKDEVLASCLGAGILFGSLGLMNRLRTC
jgi:hypothetical protein